MVLAKKKQDCTTQKIKSQAPACEEKISRTIVISPPPIKINVPNVQSPVNRVKGMPPTGKADHNIVYVEYDIKAKRIKQASSKIYIYNRADIVCLKVSKGAKIRNRYSQVPHLTQDTNVKVTT